MSRMRIVASALGLLALIAPRTSAQDLRFISGAVVVGELPLIHTGQLLPLDAKNQIVGKGQPRAQVNQLLGLLQTIVTGQGLKEGRIAKLHFYVANDSVVAEVEKALAARFPVNAKPAVSFVATPLPHPDALVAVDAVAAGSDPSQVKTVSHVRIPTLHKSVGSHAAVMPVGARVYVSGQAEKGELLDATRKTMESLRATLKFLGLTPAHVVQVKAFLNPMSRAAEVNREIASFFGQQVPPVVLVEWRSSLPIEIELIAWAGRERAGEAIEYLTPPGMKTSPVFSRVTRINHGKTIYISGQYGSSANDPAAEIGDIFKSVSSILDKTGSDFRHLAKANYYVTSDEATKKLGEIRPRFYDPKRPPAASLAKVAGTGVAGRTVSFDLVAVPSPFKNVNEYGEPEHGLGLDAPHVQAGWISLFDGKTTFGWKGAKVENGCLAGGTSTTIFQNDCHVWGEADTPGSLFIGEKSWLVAGRFNFSTYGAKGPITLDKNVRVHSLQVRFLDMKPLFDGKDLTAWQRVDHPKLPEDRRPKWEVKDGYIHAQGGPGALEYTKAPFADGVLQLEIRTRARNSNGGLFFRCVPGQMMNGYEAQIYNRCQNGDVSKPSVWSTGAIDDRQNARRLVSRDGVPFVMTVIANGPHIATWVNGYQQVDWTDTRPKQENPRQGLRVEPGPIQLQAHDAGTDIEFRAIRLAKWAK